MWIIFFVIIIILLALDLGVFHKKSHEIKIKEALTWSLVWIIISLTFNYGVYLFMGKEKALEFLAGYLIEKSLSVDNLFVFIMLFNYFQVNPKYQHKVLYWGILGALFMRAIFIFAGISLINTFHWIIYVFGAFLIFTGIKMLLEKDKEAEPDKNTIIKFVRKIINVSPEMHGGKFFIKLNERTIATPLLIVLIVVEITDLVFAVDSIPAILAISKDSFIVYSSNVFAILGLRALYFALAGITKYFYYLKYGIATILAFVGFKMTISGYYKIETTHSLFIILIILVLSILASVIHNKYISKKEIENQ